MDSLDLDVLTRESRAYEHRYLAWEVVRKCRNPFFIQGTGFEGYLIELCHSPVQALDEILGIGQGMLNSIVRLYRFNYGFRSRLMKTLTGELSDSKAMLEWSAQLGAATARLRCRLHDHPPAEAFRNQTYHIVQMLPTVLYRQDGQAIEQLYRIGFCGLEHVPKIEISMNLVRATDQDAWLVAQSVGRFGHPLVREFLRRRN